VTSHRSHCGSDHKNWSNLDFSVQSWSNHLTPLAGKNWSNHFAVLMKSKVRRSETKNENPKLTNSNPGPIRDTSSSTNIAEDDIRDDKVDFIAQCHYKEIRYNFSSYEYFQIRLEETKRRSCSRLGSDLSSPTVVSSCCATTYSSTTPYSSASPHASVTPHSAHARNHQNDAEWVKHCEELFCECRVQFQSDGIQPQETLMLSAAERQELAENAMEQLASGLNKYTLRRRRLCRVKTRL